MKSCWKKGRGRGCRYIQTWFYPNPSIHQCTHTLGEFFYHGDVELRCPAPAFNIDPFVFVCISEGKQQLALARIHQMSI